VVVACLLIAAGVTGWYVMRAREVPESVKHALGIASPSSPDPESSSASGAPDTEAPTASASTTSNYPVAATADGGTRLDGAAARTADVRTMEGDGTSDPGLAATLKAMELEPSEPEERRRFRYWYPCGPGAQASSREYEYWADASSRVSGAYAARISSLVAAPSPAGAGFCQMFRADEYRGKRVALSGHLRTVNAVPGGHLVIRADARDGRIVAQARMRESMVSGNLDWYRHTLVIDVPESAYLIMVGAVLLNTGSLWIDDVGLEIVDASWPVTPGRREPMGYSGTQPAVMVNLPPRLQDPGFEVTYVKSDR
jgi:hypothetical protein